PRIGVEGPADLVAGPALRAPRAALANPKAAGLFHHREHGEALHRPGPGHLQEAPPGAGAGLDAADVARRILVREGLGVAVEIAGLRQAQEQAIGFDFHDQNALMPVSSRPITSWCTVSVPS